MRRPSHPPVRTAALVPAAAILLIACGDVAPPATTTLVRDSAGWTIHESTEPLWQPGQEWTVSAEPVLDLTRSGAGPAHEFFSVSDALRLRDGRIAVAVPHEIRVFDAEGRFVRSLGREGDGPGEFRGAKRMARLVDSLAVYDPRLFRVTLYGPELAEPSVVVLPDRPYGAAFAWLPGAFVLTKEEPLSTEGLPFGWYRVPAAVLSLTREGTPAGRLASAAGYELVKLTADGGYLLEAPIFGRISHVAVVGASVIVGDAVELGYRVVSRDGSAGSIVRALGSDLTLTAAQLDAEREAILARYPSDEMRRLVDEMVESMPAPARRPAYRSLKVDPTGAVWLEEHRGEHAEQERVGWDTFSPDGVWLGRVWLPGRFQVFEIGLDHVLGVARDEMDVEAVRVLQLTRG